MAKWETQINVFSESHCDETEVGHGDVDLETIAEAANDTLPPSDAVSMRNVDEDDEDDDEDDEQVVSSCFLKFKCRQCLKIQTNNIQENAIQTNILRDKYLIRKKMLHLKQ